jgi:hypothetical protein
MVFTGGLNEEEIAGCEEVVGDCDSLRNRSDVEVIQAAWF